MTRDWDETFSGCPGAWYGNRPHRVLHPGKVLGNVTVDAGQVSEAVRHMRAAGYTVPETRPNRRDGGILLVIGIRKRRVWQKAEHTRAMRDLGLVKVRGALGGIYWE